MFIKESLMIYRRHRNPKSITTTRGNNPGDHIRVCHHLYKWLRERGIEKKYRRAYCIKWGNTFHDYARYCVDNVFVQNAVADLTSEEPWVHMSDKELFGSARLYTAPIREILRKERKKLSDAAGDSPGQKEQTEMNCEHVERAIENVIKVREILENEYGKSFDGLDNLLNVRLIQMREAGLRRTLEIFYRKILNRML